MSDVIKIATAIATLAHRGQVDKSGKPYIEHPIRVANILKNEGQAHWIQAIGLLHDVIEDSDYTDEDLISAGVDNHIVAAVVALTHKKGQSNQDYWEQISANAYAGRVKRADIADNTDIRRLAQLDDETIVRLVRKYAKALDTLTIG